MLHPCRRAFALAAAAALIFPALSFAAGGYPDQPIRLIVPFPPGGGTDAVARVITDGMRDDAKWNFVIDNKAGAGGNIGIEAVARSKPDGYTLGLGQTSNLAINPSLYEKVPFDAQKDFVPIAVVASQPVVLVVRADAPYRTLADLVAAAKEKPRQLTMASAGNGTVGHLTGEVFAKQAGFKSVHVPYKGAGPAATDLLGGQVTYYFATPPAVAGFIKAGKLRALAVSSAKRIPILPDTPTIAESGYKGFESTDWKMLVAPKGTPADVITKVSAEVQRALGKPATLSRLLAEGSLPGSGSPQQAAQLLKAEQQRWAATVRESNVKID